MTAGPPGSGKSTDLVALGAANWFFFSPPGGLRVDRSVLGVDVRKRVAEVRYMDDVLRSLTWVREQGFAGVGVDDATVLLTASLNRLKPNYAVFKKISENAATAIDGNLLPGIVAVPGNGAGPAYYKSAGYDWDLWSKHKQMLYDFGATCRHLGLHAAITGHVQEPFVDIKTSRRYRGGLDVAQRKATEGLVYVADLVQMTLPWPGTASWDKRAQCDPDDPDYALKDRHNMLPVHGGPLNTAEVLRGYGHDIPWPAELGAWVPSFVQHGADKLAGGVTESEVLQAGASWLEQHRIPFPHGQWALRDAIHRGRLLLHRAQSYQRLAASPSPHGSPYGSPHGGDAGASTGAQSF